MWAAETPDLSSLTSDTAISAEGYFVLSWVSGSNQNLRLQQSTESNFLDASERKIPPSGSITITGLADGEYYFRLQQGAATLSDAVQVTVKHHGISRALGFFGLGLVLFVALVMAIIVGHNKHNG